MNIKNIEWDKFEYESQNNTLDLQDFFSFSNKELLFFSLSKRKKYNKISISKRNWDIRTLYSPVYKLKSAQRKILKNIIYPNIWNSLIEGVTWFIPWKSIVDNANFHNWKKYLLKLDIKDFFPSVTQDRVFALFRTLFNFDYTTSMYLSWICCYNNQLPQWAPTSPMLANLIARFLDYRILGLMKKYNEKEWLDLTYSRYADDLTFSFNKNIKINIFIWYIIELLLEEGFFPNYDKISLISAWKQQRVTWIVVNSHSSVGRKYFKKYKSLFFNIQNSSFQNEMIRWNKKNPNNKYLKVEQFKEYLSWIMSFIYSISPDYHEKLCKYNLDFSSSDYD